MLPMYPAAPVTRMFKFGFSCSVSAFGANEDTRTAKGLLARCGRCADPGLDGGHPALEGEENQVRAAANSKFIEQVRYVELDGALRDIELARDLFIGKIFEERIEHFLLTPAQIGHRIGLQATPLAHQNGIDKSG